MNTESRNDVPCLGSQNVGQPENGVIRKSDAIRGDADLNQSRSCGEYISTTRMRRIRQLNRKRWDWLRSSASPPDSVRFALSGSN
ncbi:MAG: hypothetical protein L7V87_09285 [Verrucomicrobiales bacterium]|nr:hypothetical protein [Verrucomicrobiales bacterium]